MYLKFKPPILFIHLPIHTYLGFQHSLLGKGQSIDYVVDRIEIYLTIMDMAGSISIFDNLYTNFDELKIFEKNYDITWQPQFPQMIQKSLQWPP